MATEEQKKENLVRGLKLIIEGLAKGLWDLFGESSYAIMHSVGDDLVEIMQKEMGLELGGSNNKEIAEEVARLFIDEFGFAEKIDVKENDDSHLVIEVNQCKGFSLTKALKDVGIEHPFTCPIMNVISSIIHKQTGKRPHEIIDPLPNVRGTRLTFKIDA